MTFHVEYSPRQLMGWFSITTDFHDSPQSLFNHFVTQLSEMVCEDISMRYLLSQSNQSVILPFVLSFPRKLTKFESWIHAFLAPLMFCAAWILSSFWHMKWAKVSQGLRLQGLSLWSLLMAARPWYPGPANTCLTRLGSLASSVAFQYSVEFDPVGWHLSSMMLSKLLKAGQSKCNVRAMDSS